MRTGRTRDPATLSVKQLRLGDNSHLGANPLGCIGGLSLVRRNASRDHFGVNDEFLASQAISGICARDLETRETNATSS